MRWIILFPAILVVLCFLLTLFPFLVVDGSGVFLLFCFWGCCFAFSAWVHFLVVLWRLVCVFSLSVAFFGFFGLVLVGSVFCFLGSFCRSGVVFPDVSPRSISMFLFPSFCLCLSCSWCRYCVIV